MGVMTLLLAFVIAPVEPSVAAGSSLVITSRDRGEQLETTAVGVFDATPARVLAALEDYEGATGPMPYLVEARVIERFEDGGAVVYNRTSPPLLPDRDYTLRVRVLHDGLRYEIANERGPPPRPNVERVSWMAARWTLTPIDGGAHTRATYTVAVLADAVVPRAIEHWAARRAMAEVFAAVRVRILHAGARLDTDLAAGGGDFHARDP